MLHTILKESFLCSSHILKESFFEYRKHASEKKLRDQDNAKKNKKKILEDLTTEQNFHELLKMMIKKVESIEEGVAETALVALEKDNNA